MKKQSCRMTPQEKETHKEAGKYRRMTDAQLVELIRKLECRAEQAEENERVLRENLRGAQEVVERLRNAAVANRIAPSCPRDDSVGEITTEDTKREEMDVRGIVEGLIDALSEHANTGKGIGPGTIMRIRSIAANTATEDLKKIFFGE